MQAGVRHRSGHESHAGAVCVRVAVAGAYLALLVGIVGCQGADRWLQATKWPAPGTDAVVVEPRLSELSQSGADDFWLASSEEDEQAAADSPPAGSYGDGLTVTPLYRSASAAFYQEHYLLPEDLDTAWTGDQAACDPGDLSPALRGAFEERVNYFRAMAGVPAVITFDDEFNRKAQKAALMMSVNGRLDHWPDSSWYCFSEEGAEAAGHSTLFLGVHGPEAIDGYIEDRGEHNYFVAHRRMVLFPHTKTMGVGDLPAASGYQGSNALWVLGSMSVERPETRDSFVAWPPPGYVPYPVVFTRWSFSFPNADFGQAEVSMTHGRDLVPVQELAVVDGYGESTLVWEPQIAVGEAPEGDTWYKVSVRDVRIAHTTYHFTYYVIVFNPDA
jgi:hypothetical protein